MTAEANKEYSVNWKNHMSHVRKAFDHLLNTNELSDVTLWCEGKKIGAHKMLLSACSTYFRDTFKDVPCQHPVIIMYGVEYSVLSDILQFIYRGEVSVDTAKLDTFLKTAQLLQISGLTDDPADKVLRDNLSSSEILSSDQGAEDSFNEAATQSTPVSDDSKRGVKRIKTAETSTPREKLQKPDSDSFFISDVKCEPSELVHFEDPLEDPLLQSDQSGDTREFFVSGGAQGEDDFKNIRLSAAERQRRYRERIKNDPARRIAYLEKMRIRAQRRRQRFEDLTEREKLQKREEWRIRKQRSRQMKKLQDEPQMFI